ncbi:MULTISPECIES: hypothetical protein [Bacillus]|uniref:hypothetical protein n=1 Tax=Bacillus TaxID=1386 RepID=UPI000625D97D|nr:MULTISPECIES: hypothetical protein [Bacillus]KKK11429.1 hypothetical protein UF15_02190 [Bacillus sp. L_1B0_12]MBR0628581.1 hypothetical protein [Bacillus altitudinis S70-5-12]MDI4570351.1 hypothetical protein [Bacillus altitudinis]MEC1011040.1 hypothetical protein [Bacillus altitudinis]MED0683586.1 hypothetical protein [Bacillus altitudinis]
MKAFFWSASFLFMFILTLFILGIVFWLSGQGLDQLWRYALICLVTATVLHGVTTWLKQHVMHHPSK